MINRYYRSRNDWMDGTTEFHQMIRNATNGAGRFLEVGQGIENATSRVLADLGTVDGIDPDPSAAGNSAMSHVWDWDESGRFPIADDCYDACVSDYVVEHVDDPDMHLSEIWRVLKPGGKYLFRTPNRWHYVPVAARLTPHSIHLRTANWLRAHGPDASDPFPTRYRLNTRLAVRKGGEGHGFRLLELRMIEKEPSYLVRSKAAFLVGVGYERLVNSTSVLRGLRSNMLVTFEKPR